MEFARLGLNRRPYRPTPDTDSYFPAAAHEAVLTDLREAYEHGEDGAIMTGDSGLGKTLLAHRFLDWLPEETRKMLLPTARYAKPADLFQAILFDLGQPWQGRSDNDLRLAVTDHFLGELAADRRTVVVIDEAHHLSAEAIEELRLLANVAKPDGRAAFFLLTGLPTLRDRLETPWLAAAAQRFRARPAIEPFSDDESVRYLWHQLDRCGGRDPERILPGEAARLIADLGRGVPRLLNHVATSALSLTIAADGTCVDVEAVLEAGDRIGLHPASDETGVFLSQSEFPDSSEDSPPDTLSIRPVGREPDAVRPPKVKMPRRKSA